MWHFADPQEQNYFAKKFHCQNVSKEKPCKTLLYKKMLMKLTPVADSIKLFFFNKEEFLCFSLLNLVISLPVIFFYM